MFGLQFRVFVLSVGDLDLDFAESQVVIAKNKAVANASLRFHPAVIVSEQSERGAHCVSSLPTLANP
ncbi:hypothetical protein [Helicobacter sp. MIT 05-5294]|uniref:hypothetical protein n=1 Tax=Helicobacter sp. MIT 05-5294 TaxID=1548150 RepID=UPI00051FDACB|nr:hypothetical protein [Helicobacter sp. MIT 05-5294]TLD88136.1 hypothetical protein LS69_002435 [Helicobacter sp. MIT 05-5294]